MPSCEHGARAHSWCTFIHGHAMATENGRLQHCQDCMDLPRPPPPAHAIFRITLPIVPPLHRSYNDCEQSDLTTLLGEARALIRTADTLPGVIPPPARVTMCSPLQGSSTPSPR